jgi:hypothetical protein
VEQLVELQVFAPSTSSMPTILTSVPRTPGGTRREPAEIRASAKRQIKLDYPNAPPPVLIGTSICSSTDYIVGPARIEGDVDDEKIIAATGIQLDIEKIAPTVKHRRALRVILALVLVTFAMSGALLTHTQLPAHSLVHTAAESAAAASHSPRPPRNKIVLQVLSFLATLCVFSGQLEAVPLVAVMKAGLRKALASGGSAALASAGGGTLAITSNSGVALASAASSSVALPAGVIGSLAVAARVVMRGAQQVPLVLAAKPIADMSAAAGAGVGVGMRFRPLMLGLGIVVGWFV